MPFTRDTRNGLLVLTLFAALLVLGLAFQDEEWVEVFLILALGLLMLLWVWQWNQAPRQQALLSRGRFLIGNCELIPRRDATPEQLKQLGNALARWWESLGGEANPGPHWIDTHALDDLHAGELPQPFVLRLLTEVNSRPQSQGLWRPISRSGRMKTQELRDALQRAREAYPQLSELIPQADSRTVQFGLKPASKADRERLLGSLRRAVPADLVEDVLIEGHSWDVVE